jgi:1-acyl-sn-glycerol-3-phosphate acyltransferase
VPHSGAAVSERASETRDTSSTRASANGASAAAASPGRSRGRVTIPGPEALGIVARLAQGAASTVAEQARGRVPRADLDERDPDYVRERLPGLWMLASLYFRADVRGLHHIPAEGPVLLVGNHSGGNVAADTLVFTLAFSTYFGVERRFHQLAHNLVMSMPGLARLRKYGTVTASPENARRALDLGAALLVYPGGDYEAHRPSWQSAKVDFAGRKGFIRLALERRVPIVPVVAIGGQETALFLSRGERLARLLRLDRMFRLKVLPISIALPWGLNVGDMLGHLPLPAKITIQVLPPIEVERLFGPSPDLDEVYFEVLSSMQDTLRELQAKRRLPLVG